MKPTTAERMKLISTLTQELPPGGMTNGTLRLGLAKFSHYPSTLPSTHIHLK